MNDKAGGKAPISEVRREYHKPRLKVYGDLRGLTMGSQGPQRDGSSGAPKSRATGSG